MVTKYNSRVIYHIKLMTMATIKASASKASKAPASKTPSFGKKISIDLIRSRAHEIYLQRTKFGIPGDSESDWLRAEKEFTKKQELTK